MTSRRWGSRTAVVAITVGALWSTPAAFAESVPAPTVPDEVAAYAAGPLAQEVQDIAAGMVYASGDDGMGPPPDYSGDLVVGMVHQPFQFTDTWLGGDPAAVPVEPLPEWVAPLIVDGVAMGTVRIWEPQGVPELAVFDDDAVLSRSLVELSETAVLVEDARAQGFFTLSGEVLTPVDTAGPQEFDSPVALAPAQKVMAAREQRAADVAQPTGPFWNRAQVAFLSLVGVALLVSAAVAVAAVASRRRRAV